MAVFENMPVALDMIIGVVQRADGRAADSGDALPRNCRG